MWLDVIILVILCAGALQGLRRGLVRQLLDVAGMIAAMVLAYRMYPQVGGAVSGWFHLSQPLANIVGFALVLVAIGLAVGTIGSMISGMLKMTGLGWADQLGGAGVGLVKSFLLIALLLMLLVSLPIEPVAQTLRQSELAQWVIVQVPGLYEVVRPWAPVQSLPDKLKERDAQEPKKSPGKGLLQ